MQLGEDCFVCECINCGKYFFSDYPKDIVCSFCIQLLKIRKEVLGLDDVLIRLGITLE